MCLHGFCTMYVYNLWAQQTQAHVYDIVQGRENTCLFFSISTQKRVIQFEF